MIAHNAFKRIRNMEEIFNKALYIDTVLFVFFNANIVFGVTVATIFVMKLKEYSKTSANKAMFAYFIGTFFHELAHYITAFVLTGFRKPEQISFIAKSNESGYQLGFVGINPKKLNWFNRTPIAFSPILLIYLAYLFHSNFEYIVSYLGYVQYSTLSLLFYSFIVSTLIVNSIPSRADISIALGSYSLFIWVFILLVILFIKTTELINVI